MKILQITSFEDKNLKLSGCIYQNYDGYHIATDDTDIYLLINSGHSCCERYGYACTEDNLEDFIGATILNFEVVDSDRAVTANKLMDTEIYKMQDVYEGDIMFLNVNTERGTLQFSVYNEHNGYYGHNALVVVNNQIIFEGTL